MAQEQTFKKVNELLESVGYEAKISSLADLKKFLNSAENREDRVYSEVEDLYYALILGKGMW